MIGLEQVTGRYSSTFATGSTLPVWISPLRKYVRQAHGGMGDRAMAEAPLQGHGQPEEQPADFRGRQIRVRQQQRHRRQPPTGPVGFVAKQGRAAQVTGRTRRRGGWGGSRGFPPATPRRRTRGHLESPDRSGKSPPPGAAAPAPKRQCGRSSPDWSATPYCPNGISWFGLHDG